jgi:hypothetical protein
MKSNRAYKLWILIGIVTIIVASIVVMRDPIFMDSQEISYPDVLLSGYPDTGSYKFDSETILEALDRGDLDVFVPSSTPLAHPIPSSWKQTDYLTIANALHRYVWKETLEDLTLHDLMFYGDCQSDPIKFDVINFTYYKTIPILQYTARMIVIYPLNGEVAWGGGANYPRSIFEKWKGINLQMLKITADDALQIAEDNGGREAHLSINNGCRVHISLSSNDQYWHVTYSDERAYNIFEIIIDAYTGEHKILNSNQ